MDLQKKIEEAAPILARPAGCLVFTGAGISVESGIPPFRGVDGLWEKYDPDFIELSYFHKYPKRCWQQIRSLFYDNWGKAEPNPAHYAIADLQKLGFVHTIVTQNIDCLHQRAGASDVVEFHGTLDRLDCQKCSFTSPPTPELLAGEPPECPVCHTVLKPAFVFYSEGIPEDAIEKSFSAIRKVSSVLIVGTSGEVMPACQIPIEAKRNGAVVIEVNPNESTFTRNGVTDVFLQGSAGMILPRLVQAVRNVRKAENS